MLDYAKYENATPKELVYALSLTEKRVEKLEGQIKENKEFFKFLQTKLKKSFSIKKSKIKKDEPTQETLEALNSNESLGVFENFDDFKKALES